MVGGRHLVIVAAVLALTGCGGSSSGSQKTTSTTAESLNATQVAEQLKSSGVPITHSVTDVTEASPESNARGLKSGAATATDDSDIFVEVYDDAEARNKARLAMIEAAPGGTFIAECGPILVYIPKVESDAPTQRQQRNQIQNVLEDKYGPC